jgi:NAD(P)-dependent dehydrogenase (short-subunit alcohol dehydrogenase family)
MARYDVGGRAAIVTGGGSGIGRAVALELAANGAAVLVADLSREAAEAVAHEIDAAGGTGRPFVADVSDYSAVEAMVKAGGELGPLRIAVNNAGIGGEAAPLADYTLDGWHKVIAVNLDSVFYCIKAEIPAMIAAGGGSIVNMASVLGSVGIPMSSAYVTAKHGVVGMTKNAALEYAAQGVRVNAVGPGFITTPLLEANLDEAAVEYLGGQHALGRMGTSEEVSALVAFLASDAASFITGSYHLVDGGYAAH